MPDSPTDGASPEVVDVLDEQACRRIERTATHALSALVEHVIERLPGCGTTMLPVGEGIAFSGGDAIPFSEVAGVATDSRAGEAEVEVLEAFYDDAGCEATVLVPSFADPTFLSALDGRGWRPSGFEDVFAADMRRLDSVAAPTGVDIREVAPAERDRWAACVARGFAAPRTPTAIESRFCDAASSRSETRLFWIWVDGEPVATGELELVDGVAWLTSDTTTPGYRERGYQRALQEYRVEAARRAGASLVAAEARPGGSSHRNMRRLGLELVYTHLLMRKDFSR